jgi:hypothetical protein
VGVGVAVAVAAVGAAKLIDDPKPIPGEADPLQAGPFMACGSCQSRAAVRAIPRTASAVRRTRGLRLTRLQCQTCADYKVMGAGAADGADR